MKVPSLSMVPGYQSPKEGERGRGRGRGRGREGEAGGKREREREGERGRGRGRGREGEGGGEKEREEEGKGREREGGGGGGGGERGRKGHSWVPQHMVHKKPKAENTLNSLYCLAVLFCTSFCNGNNLNADKRL